MEPKKVGFPHNPYLIKNGVLLLGEDNSPTIGMKEQRKQ